MLYSAGSKCWPLTLTVILASCSGEISTEEVRGAAGGDRPPATNLTPTHAESIAADMFPGASLRLLPRRVWRLTNNQIQVALETSLGFSLPLESDLSADPEDGRYRNNQALLSLTKAEVEGLQRVGDRVYAELLKSVPQKLPCVANSGVDEACAFPFLRALGGNLYRHPLEPDEEKRVLDLYRSLRSSHSVAESVAGAVSFMVQAPAFVFKSETGHLVGNRAQLSSFEVASALSWLLWNQPPDNTLTTAASTGRLADADAIEREARRLVADDRFLEAMGAFLAQWLEYDELANVTKDAALKPAFTQSLRQAMEAEIDAFVRRIFRADNGDLRVLLTDQSGFDTTTLAAIYEQDVREGDKLTTRSGLLLLPGVLAAGSGPNSTEPMKRGGRLLDRLFCVQAHPPPGLEIPAPPEPLPNSTTRERFTQHRESPVCSACHTLLDPLAFALEAYDPLGKHRTTENGRPIDATGEILYTQDPIGRFADAPELFRKAALTKDVQACFVKQMFEYTFGLPPYDDAAPVLRDAMKRFVESGFDIRELLVALVTSDLFLFRAAAEGAQ